MRNQHFIGLNVGSTNPVQIISVLHTVATKQFLSVTLLRPISDTEYNSSALNYELQKIQHSGGNVQSASRTP